MSGRHYGQVATSVWHSRRFNKLDGPVGRLAYLYLLSSDRANMVGLFRFSPHHLAGDVRDIQGADHAEAVLADMQAAGLIDRDQDDYVRVARWFQTMPPYNPSVVINCIKLLNDRALRRGELRSRQLWELMFSAYLTAQNWKPGTGPRLEMEALLETTFRQEVERDPALAEASVRHLELDPSDTVWDMVWDTWGTQIKAKAHRS